MAQDVLTFKCIDCDTTVMIDEANPPSDEEEIACGGCGRVFGPYAEVREAAMKAARDFVDDLVQRKFGAKPTWK